MIPDSAAILSRANQTIDTLERYKTRLDEVSRQLSTAEIEDFVTLRDVMTVVQRLEMVRRISLEIDSDVVELGTDGRQLKLQLEELVGDNDTARELIVRDYHANPDPPTPAQVSATLEELDALSDNELLDFTTLARVFGYPSTAGSAGFGDELARLPRDGGHPRLQFAHVDLLVRSFGSLQGLLAATSDDLQSVEGIGSMWARHIREGLSQLAESTIADRLASPNGLLWLRADLLGELEAGAIPNDEDAAKIKTQSLPSVGCLAPNTSSIMSPSRGNRRSHTSTAGTKSSLPTTPARRNSRLAAQARVRRAARPPPVVCLTGRDGRGEDERHRRRPQIAQLHDEVVSARPDWLTRQRTLRRRAHARPGHLGRHLLTRLERLDQRLVRRRAVEVRPQPGVVQRVHIGGQHRGTDVALACDQADVGNDHGELRLSPTTYCG